MVIAQSSWKKATAMTYRWAGAVPEVCPPRLDDSADPGCADAMAEGRTGAARLNLPASAGGPAARSPGAGRVVARPDVGGPVDRIRRPTCWWWAWPRRRLGLGPMTRPRIGELSKATGIGRGPVVWS